MIFKENKSTVQKIFEYLYRFRIEQNNCLGNRFRGQKWDFKLLIP